MVTIISISPLKIRSLLPVINGLPPMSIGIAIVITLAIILWCGSLSKYNSFRCIYFCFPETPYIKSPMTYYSPGYFTPFFLLHCMDILWSVRNLRAIKWYFHVQLSLLKMSIHGGHICKALYGALYLKKNKITNKWRKWSIILSKYNSKIHKILIYLPTKDLMHPPSLYHQTGRTKSSFFLR